jgi:PIN like domain
VKFFFDNSVAPKVAKILNGFLSPEHQVVHVRERFPAGGDDSAWMTQLAKEESWIIVTAEARTGNPHEIEAWKESNHTVFSLEPGWLQLDFWEQAQKFVKCFPEIIKNAERAAPGASFTVSVNGKIQN